MADKQPEEKWKAYWQRFKHAFRRRSKAEWTELRKEFGSQVRKGLVAAFIAVLLVILGLPQITRWYQSFEEWWYNPPRTVYLRIMALEAYSLRPIDSVYVQIIGNETTTAYTASTGKSVLTYEAAAGENEVDLTLIRSGYRDVHYPKLGLPPGDGDSSSWIKIHLHPDKTPQLAPAIQNSPVLY